MAIREASSLTNWGSTPKPRKIWKPFLSKHLTGAMFWLVVRSTGRKSLLLSIARNYWGLGVEPQRGVPAYNPYNPKITASKEPHESTIDWYQQIQDTALA